MLVVKNLVEESFLVKLQAGGRPATLLKKTLSKILFTVFLSEVKVGGRPATLLKKTLSKILFTVFLSEVKAQYFNE